MTSLAVLLSWSLMDLSAPFMRRARTGRVEWRVSTDLTARWRGVRPFRSCAEREGDMLKR